MTKKNFIALANHIKFDNKGYTGAMPFTKSQIESLADFCASQSSKFKRETWLGYINGISGPSGGRIKKAVKAQERLT